MAQPTSYAYVIERAADGSYWAYLPDLPGCTTTGDTPEKSSGSFAKRSSFT